MEPDNFPYNVQQDMQSVEPVGIVPLLPEGNKGIDIRSAVTTAARNKLLELAASKAGLNENITRGVAGLLGVGSNMFAPLAVASALTGRSLGISDYLSNKRTQKAIARNNREDPQGTINTVPTKIMNMQPSAQDIARGGGNIPASTKATSAPAPTQSRQTSGIGGLHSGY
jgi:hypothetical protein